MFFTKHVTRGLMVMAFLLAAHFSQGQNIKTVVGNGTAGYAGDGGPDTLAEINFPGFLSFGGAGYGSLFIGDRLNYRVRELKLGPGAIIFTRAGDGINGFYGDGGPATAAELNYPGGIAIDRQGNIFICDCYNNRIRRIDAFTGVISSVAGTGVAGYSGDWGPATAAKLNQPVDIAVDHYNNVYFVDWNNSRIRTFYSPLTITCDTVTGLAVSSITSTSANLSWAAVTGSVGYEYTVDMSAASPSAPGTFIAATTVTVTGLTPGQNYYAHVLDSCGAGNLSEWVTVPFSTPSLTTCDTVTGLSVSAITSTSATVSWTAVAGSLGYDYVVNTSASAPATPGTTTTATSVPVTSLFAGTSYYAHVLDSCGAGNLSAWITVPFSTLPSSTGIAQVGNDLHITALPNPADNVLTIRIAGKTGNNAQLILTDVTGRHVTTVKVNANTQVLDMSALHPGVYFVRYIDDEQVQTMRIIKA